MRPQSIIAFERLYALAIVIGVVQATLFVGQLNTELWHGGPIAIIGYLTILISAGIPLLLLWLVSRRASDPARWVVVALTALSVAGMAWSLIQRGYLFNLYGWLGLLHHALTVAAAAMTFRRDAQAWLVRRRPEIVE